VRPSKITFRRRRRNIWKTTIPPQIKAATIPPLSPAIKVTELLELVLVGTTALVVIDAIVTIVLSDVVTGVKVIGNVFAAVTLAPEEEDAHVDRLHVQE